MSKTRDYILFYLNGVRTEVRGDQAFQTVAHFLRYQRGLIGTKIVCAEGDCGACSILKASVFDPSLQAINSCIALVSQMDGAHLVTVEGLKNGETLDPVQSAMVKCHGSQCGYCTPGFVVTMAWMREQTQCKPIDSQTAKNYLTGNLCRCTGYQPIIDAAIEASKEKPPQELLARYSSKKSWDDLKKTVKIPIQILTDKKFFFSPTSLSGLRIIRKKYPTSTILGAATDLGVQYNKGKNPLATLVSLQSLAELYQIKKKSKKLQVGARITLAQLRRAFAQAKAPELEETLNLFASPQIKNSATLVGNIANASPIADTPPVMLAMGADVEIFSAQTGKKSIVPLDQFFLGYRKTALKKGDVILSIGIPLLEKGEKFKFFKNSQRKDLDISCVNIATWAKWDARGKLSHLRIACGGVAATPLRMKEAERILVQSGDVKTAIERSIEAVQEAVDPLTDLRGSAAYRRVLLEQGMRSMLHEILSP